MSRLCFSLALTLLSSVSDPVRATPDANAGAQADPHALDLRIWCIDQDQRGHHWFGSNGNGVYRYDGERLVRYTQADGLVGAQVRDIRQDAEGNVLIATNSGVSLFDGETFRALEVVDVAWGEKEWKSAPGDVWMICNPGFGGPCRYDGERVYRLELPLSPKEQGPRRAFPQARFEPAGVYTVYQDRRGHQWFGTAALGLCRYDGETLSWMYEERLTTTPEGGAFGIRSIYEDKAGDFWICNTRQRFEVSLEPADQSGHALIQHSAKPGLPGSELDSSETFSYFASITEDPAGALWMACGDDGVWKYDGREVTRHAIGDGAWVIRIFCDQQGKLWAGTVDQGVYVLGDEGFEPFLP